MTDDRFAVAENSRQQVVEIVGDAARQTSHAFQLLRADELLLERTTFRDVFGDPHDSAHHTVRVGDGDATVMDAPCPVGVDQAILLLEATAECVRS